MLLSTRIYRETRRMAIWRYGETNNIIDNFQKSPRFKGTPAWDRYKQSAIVQLANEIRAALPPARCGAFTFVPVPGSKSKTDPEYDDRLYRLLDLYRRGFTV